MVRKGLTSCNKLELRVYRLLGIREFRKAILLFEKINHHKDNRKNENYHPSNVNVFALEQYNGFLLYNAFLHVASLFFSGMYLLFTLTFGVRITVVDVFMAILSLLNIYCIFLQRNNYLKIKDYCFRYYYRFYNKAKLCSEDIIQRIATQGLQQIQADYDVICRIKNAFEGRADCVLSVADTDSLKRICEYIEPILQRKSNRLIKGVIEVGLMEKCNSVSGPYTSLQKRTDWLQRKLGFSGRKMLDRTVIITEDMECEMLYRKLAPDESAYNMYFVCLFLDEVFAGMADKGRANDA